MPTFQIKLKASLHGKNSLFLNLPMIEPSLILLILLHHSWFYNLAFPFLGVRQSRLSSTRVCNLALSYLEYRQLL